MARGETIEVTDRGRPVALLTPTHIDRWQALIASGQVIAATDPGSILDDPPVDEGINAYVRLMALRESER